MNERRGKRGAAHGERLREVLGMRSMFPFIGVYDVFSATVAGRHFDGLFVSGYSFSASHYGLPDRGFIAWSDIAGFVHRVRTVLPGHHILVDMDDGYGDTETACHAVSVLESLGASGVVLEDQQRPRRCGHLEGKQLMPLDAYLDKLGQVLKTRRDLFVVARTDAADREDILRRAQAFAAAGADAVLADGIDDLELLRELRSRVSCPLMFNQIAGGKSPAYSYDELKAAGVSLVNYSTPCLFAAQDAIDAAMRALKVSGGRLSEGVDLASCNELLEQSLSRRDKR